MHFQRAFLVAAFGASVVVAAASSAPSWAADRSEVVSDSIPLIPDSLRGRSGQLRVAISPVLADSSGPSSRGLVGTTVWSLPDARTGSLFHFVTLLPFSEKQNGRVGTFQVGRWPAERRAPLGPAYRVPLGFIELTPELTSMSVSTHFTFGEFLSVRSQRDVWPKPLVLDLRLVDKLELIIEALSDSGFASPRLTVMSAFRTPSVTAAGARTAQAPESRHQYGDAADIIADADGDGRMDDLTRDKRVDLADARYLIRIVLAVEAAHPELVGGIGLYRGTGKAGPFVHVDARGERARWGLQ
jgi:hypothetical protein